MKRFTTYLWKDLQHIYEKQTRIYRTCHCASKRKKFSIV